MGKVQLKNGNVKILLSNDDGVQAPGLQCLYQQLKTQHEVMVVGPDRNCSGTSHSLTLFRPLRLHSYFEGFYSVDGTPADAVQLALSTVLPALYWQPDIVVAGINAGANLGEDTIYSGTVAAATEGRGLRYPPLAVSTTAHQPQYFETAGRLALALLAQIAQPDQPFPNDWVLNLNVPDVAEVKGLRYTRLGRRHAPKPTPVQQDPRGRDIYWVPAVGAVKDAEADTDFAAVQDGYATLTPLQMDLTHSQALAWLRAR